MKAVRPLFAGVALALAVLGADVASAATMWGKVRFVGTISEEYSEGYHARLRVLVNGTCDTDAMPADRWVHIRSGRMEDIYGHNSVNMRNAYSTLIAALLADKVVQIDGLPHCNTRDSISMDLWTGRVGLF